MADIDLDPPHYEPSEADKAVIREVEDFYQEVRQTRTAHEGQWFLNGAMLRGNQHVEWSKQDQKLVTPPASKSRRRVTINKLQPKNRARQAKFLKNRPIPVVIPATQDVEDKLDARATTKAFSYIARTARLEQKYADALRWASMCGHGYWWFYWDPAIQGRVKIKDELTGQEQVMTTPLGDVAVEVGSPFEVFVADASIHYIGDQPKIMRVRERSLDDIAQRYPDKAQFVRAEQKNDEALRYEKQLSELSATAAGGLGIQSAKGSGSPKSKTATVKELFCRPTKTHPNGQYLVVANGVLLRNQPNLPENGFSSHANPYPVADFLDVPTVGQYYLPTIVEQAIPIQREYNDLRSRLSEHTRLCVHPKLLVARQHNLPPGSWTNAAGEIVEYVAHPSIEKPTPYQQPPISADVWRSFDLLDRELSDLFQIFPESQGGGGKSTSGFQTSLLQEANDSVHAPDQRANELVMIEAYYKIRHLIKQGYSVPRLITVTGNHLAGEALEFSRDDIDEAADIIVETGSALPNGKAERTQFLVELGAAGWLGNPADPNDRARFLNYLEMGSVEDAYDFDRRDEELARLENIAFDESRPVKSPDFFENHDLHQRLHADKLKSVGAQMWDEEQRSAAIHHLLEHIKWINPQAAMQLATMYGDQQLIAQITQEQAATGGAAPAAAGASPQQGAPAPAQQGPPATANPDQPM